MKQTDSLEKFIYPRSKKPFAWLVILAAVVMLMLGLYKDFERNFCIVPLSTDNITVSKPVYTDVIAVSEPLYTIQNDAGGTRYCLALDTNGNRFIVRLYADVYDQLHVQRKAWNSSTQDSAEPFRLRGSMKKLLPVNQQSIASAVSDSDTYDLTYYFHLEEAIGLYFLSIFPGLIGIVSLMMIDWYEERGKESLHRLDTLGLTKEAFRQFKDRANYLYHDDYFIMSADFIISKTYHTVIPYSDVVWCASVMEDVNRGAPEHLRPHSLVIATLDCPLRAIRVMDSVENIDRMISIIQSKKPDVLVGKTVENHLKYAEIVENNKKRNLI